MVEGTYIKQKVSPMIFTVEEIKEYLKVDHADEDELIEAIIKESVDWAEEYCWRSLAPTEFKAYFADWGDELLIKRNPIYSVESIEYYDLTNTLQTWDSSNYMVISGRVPGKIQYAESTTLPSLYARDDAVVLTFKAGQAQELIPQGIMSQIKKLIAYSYENREDRFIEGRLFSIAQKLLWPYRYYVN